MKKLILIMMMVVAMSTGQAFAKDVGTQVESGMKQFFESNNIPLGINIEVIKKLKEPKGLYFIKMVLTDNKSGRTQEQLVFTDGKYIMPDVLTVDTNTSLKDVLSFESAKKVDIDVSGLTLIDGKKGAKHTIIEVSDFQCHYCKRAYAYLHNEIKQRNLDVAVYMMHLPLEFHNHAKLYAAIFEAGKQVGSDFGGQLYATNKKVDEMADADVIEMFAKQTSNPAKFKALVKSPSIAGKIAAEAKKANSMGITGTPHMFFDGKPVGGFKQSMYKLALDSFK